MGDAEIVEDCDPELETTVLLGAVIHDFRTPLSAMSGWLEVLETLLAESPESARYERALKGLRRSVSAQTTVLNTLSETLASQRGQSAPNGECVLLERMQIALGRLESRREAVEPPPKAHGPETQRLETHRLAALREFVAAGSLTCANGGPLLDDACGVLIHALALAQTDADGPITISTQENRIDIEIPGGSGDASPLRALFRGFSGYAVRRPDIRLQSLWLARSIFLRCRLALQISAATAGDIRLTLRRRAAA